MQLPSGIQYDHLLIGTQGCISLLEIMIGYSAAVVIRGSRKVHVVRTKCSTSDWTMATCIDRDLGNHHILVGLVARQNLGFEFI